MSVFPTFNGEDYKHRKGDALEGKNLLLVGTGSISAMYLPAWISWFSEAHPGTKLRVILTPAAKGFVGLSALGAFTDSQFDIDSWVGHETEAYHVDLYSWSDAFIVYPATADYVARFALGACDSPSLLALQATKNPVILAPALPPGFLDSEAWRIYQEALSRRDNVHVAPPVIGHSTYERSIEAFPPQPFNKVVAELESCISSTESEMKERLN